MKKSRGKEVEIGNSERRVGRERIKVGASIDFL
jgi:hypothetical protein